MTNEEIEKLLKEAHDHGYENGWYKGKDDGLRSVAIGINTGYPNKIKSQELFTLRLKKVEL